MERQHIALNPSLRPSRRLRKPLRLSLPPRKEELRKECKALAAINLVDPI